jgi:hypothetical protein
MNVVETVVVLEVVTVKVASRILVAVETVVVVEVTVAAVCWCFFTDKVASRFLVLDETVVLLEVIVGFVVEVVAALVEGVMVSVVIEGILEL